MRLGRRGEKASGTSEVVFMRRDSRIRLLLVAIINHLGTVLRRELPIRLPPLFEAIYAAFSPSLLFDVDL